MFHGFHARQARRFARAESGHGHGGHGGRHPFRRGGRGGRVFDQGDLRFVALQLIAEKPRHGYEIIKEIEARLGGAYSPSPGVVYPTLTLLEELGYVRVAAAEGGKKLYEATPEGRALLEENRASVDGIMARMSDLGGGADEGHSTPRLIRAVRNLKMALRLRLARGAMSDEETQHVVETLDALVARIERS